MTEREPDMTQTISIWLQESYDKAFEKAWSMLRDHCYRNRDPIPDLKTMGQVLQYLRTAYRIAWYEDQGRYSQSGYKGKY